jgi:outer membrane receptor protein involved in Fe transport
VTWQDYGDRRTGSERISPSDYDSTAADAKLLFGLGEYSDLMLSYQTVDQPNTPRVDELIPGFGQDEPSSELFAFRPNQRDFYHARLRTAPGLLWLDHVEVHLARQTITDDRRTRDFGSPLTTDESNESELTGLTVELGTPLTSRLHLTYGVELYYDDVSSSRRRTDSTTGVTERVPGRFPDDSFPDDSSMDSIAGYLYGEWDPHPNLTIGGGMRYSRFDIKLPQASGGDATLEPDDVSGDLHVTWRLTEGLNLVSNLGRGFRAPNIFDLGTLPTPTSIRRRSGVSMPASSSPAPAGARSCSASIRTTTTRSPRLRPARSRLKAAPWCAARMPTRSRSTASRPAGNTS